MAGKQTTPLCPEPGKNFAPAKRKHEAISAIDNDCDPGSRVTEKIQLDYAGYSRSTGGMSRVFIFSGIFSPGNLTRLNDARSSGAVALRKRLKPS